MYEGINKAFIQDQEFCDTAELGIIGEHVSKMSEEISEMNHLLGENFGTENRVDLIDLTEEMKEDFWSQAQLASILSGIQRWVQNFYADYSDEKGFSFYGTY